MELQFKDKQENISLEEYNKATSVYFTYYKIEKNIIHLELLTSKQYYYLISEIDFYIVHGTISNKYKRLIKRARKQLIPKIYISRKTDPAIIYARQYNFAGFKHYCELNKDKANQLDFYNTVLTAASLAYKDALFLEYIINNNFKTFPITLKYTTIDYAKYPKFLELLFSINKITNKKACVLYPATFHYFKSKGINISSKCYGFAITHNHYKMIKFLCLHKNLITYWEINRIKTMLDSAQGEKRRKIKKCLRCLKNHLGFIDEEDFKENIINHPDYNERLISLIDKGFILNHDLCNLIFTCEHVTDIKFLKYHYKKYGKLPSDELLLNMNPLISKSANNVIEWFCQKSHISYQSNLLESVRVQNFEAFKIIIKIFFEKAYKHDSIGVITSILLETLGLIKDKPSFAMYLRLVLNTYGSKEVILSELQSF